MDKSSSLTADWSKPLKRIANNEQKFFKRLWFSVWNRFALKVNQSDAKFPTATALGYFQEEPVNPFLQPHSDAVLVNGQPPHATELVDQFAVQPDLDTVVASNPQLSFHFAFNHELGVSVAGDIFRLTENSRQVNYALRVNNAMFLPSELPSVKSQCLVQVRHTRFVNEGLVKSAVVGIGQRTEKPPSDDES